MALDQGPSSRFQFSTPVIFAGEEMYGIWQPPPFAIDPSSLPPQSIGTIAITTGSECRPDLISQQVYGTPFLDWLIISFNNPQEVFNWPKAGTVVQYPAPDVVARYIS